MVKLFVSIDGQLRRLSLKGEVEGLDQPVQIIMEMGGRLVPVSSKSLRYVVPGPRLLFRRRRRRYRRHTSRTSTVGEKKSAPAEETPQEYSTIPDSTSEEPRSPVEQNARINQTEQQQETETFEISQTEPEEETERLEPETEPEEETERLEPAWAGRETKPTGIDTKIFWVGHDDVGAIRQFLQNNVKEIDIERFDRDPNYTFEVLLKYKPAVRLIRDTASFARQLGLCQKKPALGSGTTTNTSKAQPVAVPSITPVEHRIRHHVPDRKRAQSTMQVEKMKRDSEYTALEDQTIVAWLTASPVRERAVNGNAIWRELQLDFPRLTGKARSWQSLRARYLRYLLPSLNTRLLIPSAQAKRLRANAAAGIIKGRKMRRNSALVQRQVISAFSRAAGARNRPRRSCRLDKSMSMSPAKPSTVPVDSAPKRRPLYTPAVPLL